MSHSPEPVFFFGSDYRTLYVMAAGVEAKKVAPLGGHELLDMLRDECGHVALMPMLINESLETALDRVGLRISARFGVTT